LLTVFSALLLFKFDWSAAGQWLLQAGLLWVYVLVCAWRRLALNRADAESPLYLSLGWGNRLTILRGGLIALTGGFLFMPQKLADLAWLPALFYTLAATLDRLDGFAARRSGQVSLLGNELDITFDALGLVVAPLLAIELGTLHGSYLLLSAAYYVYRWSLQRRYRLNLPVQAPPKNPLRRTLAGFQMAFVALALWPLLNPALTIVVGIAVMLPVLFGFAADWWVVCGRLKPRTYSRMAQWSAQFLLPGLRALLLLLLLMPAAIDSAGNPPLFGLALGVGLIALGCAGRAGALILIAVLSENFPGGYGVVASYLLIFSASWILLLGTGRCSLWPWGDEWIQRYDGA
jgi:phosphatidylglycerophosphate synthase